MVQRDTCKPRGLHGISINFYRYLKKRIAILGSTGSIGTQALDVIRHHAEHFSIEVLTANFNAELLIEQALEFKPDSVVIVNECHYKKVKDILSPHQIKVYTGTEALSQVVELDNIDLVLAALVGFAGLKPTLKSNRIRKTNCSCK